MSYQRSGDFKIVSFDVDVFREALDSTIGNANEAVKKAIYSTMSKTRKHAVTSLSTIVREKWNIRKKDLDDRIRVWAGERDRGYESFEMTVKGKSVSLAHFGAIERKGNIQQTIKTGRRMKRIRGDQGVSVEVYRGKRFTLASAWFQVVPGWGITVRRRKSNDRDSATIQAVISPASFLNDAELADRFENGVIDFIERTFYHELEWRLSQIGLA